MINKMNFLQLLLIINTFVIIESSTTFAQEFLNLGPKPDKIHIDGNNRFFVDYGYSIIVYLNKVEASVKPFNPDSNYRFAGSINAVSFLDSIIFLFKSSYTPEKSEYILQF